MKNNTELGPTEKIHVEFENAFNDDFLMDYEDIPHHTIADVPDSYVGNGVTKQTNLEWEIDDYLPPLWNEYQDDIIANALENPVDMEKEFAAFLGYLTTFNLGKHTKNNQKYIREIFKQFSPNNNAEEINTHLIQIQNYVKCGNGIDRLMMALDKIKQEENRYAILSVLITDEASIRELIRKVERNVNRYTFMPIDPFFIELLNKNIAILLQSLPMKGKQLTKRLSREDVYTFSTETNAVSNTHTVVFPQPPNFCAIPVLSHIQLMNEILFNECQALHTQLLMPMLNPNTLLAVGQPIPAPNMLTLQNFPTPMILAHNAEPMLQSHFRSNLAAFSMFNNYAHTTEAPNEVRTHYPIGK